MSQDGMDVISKVCYMLLRENLVPRKERHEKVDILGIILINKMLDEEKISLPLLILKHLTMVSHMELSSEKSLSISSSIKRDLTL